MTDSTVYPGAIDPDMAALVPDESLPAEWRDWAKQVSSAVRAIEQALGTDPVIGGGGSALHVVTDTDTANVQATDSYAPLDDTDLRTTVPDGHADRVLVTFQAVPYCVDAAFLFWMPDDGSGTPLADMVIVATSNEPAHPGLTCVQFLLDPAPVGEFQLRWGQVATIVSGSSVGTAWGGDLGPAIITWQDVVD